MNESNMSHPVFSADMWLLYGSFAYGVECLVKDVQLDSLLLTLSYSCDMKDKFNFVKGIFEEPKGLLRVELRIYGPELFLKNLASLALFLFTPNINLLQISIKPRACFLYSRYKMQFFHQTSLGKVFCVKLHDSSYFMAFKKNP